MYSLKMAVYRANVTRLAAKVSIAWLLLLLLNSTFSIVQPKFELVVAVLVSIGAVSVLGFPWELLRLGSPNVTDLMSDTSASWKSQGYYILVAVVMMIVSISNIQFGADQATRGITVLINLATIPLVIKLTGVSTQLYTKAIDDLKSQDKNISV
jgi:hypothetical protein